VVAERHRLRGLQMGEARYRVARMLRGAFHQCQHQVGKLRVQPVDRVAHPKPKIRRHLVVAAARGVQPAAGLTDAFGQPGLDVHVDVFECHVEREASALDLVRDRPQPAADRLLFVGA
jgi:hypothetical protein